MNKNDKPLESLNALQDQVDYGEFQYKEYFIHLCNLLPDKGRESLKVEKLQGAEPTDKVRESSLVYLIVVRGKVFKIGATINTIEDRVQSYNCGKLKHRRAGTCSTTNFFVLQSLININEPAAIYAYFPDKEGYEIFGEKGEEAFPSPKIIERKILKDFAKKHHGKPIGNIQR